MATLLAQFFLSYHNSHLEFSNRNEKLLVDFRHESGAQMTAETIDELIKYDQKAEI